MNIDKNSPLNLYTMMSAIVQASVVAPTLNHVTNIAGPSGRRLPDAGVCKSHLAEEIKIRARILWANRGICRIKPCFVCDKLKLKEKSCTGASKLTHQNSRQSGMPYPIKPPAKSLKAGYRSARARDLSVHNRRDKICDDDVPNILIRP